MEKKKISLSDEEAEKILREEVNRRNKEKERAEEALRKEQRKDSDEEEQCRWDRMVDKGTDIFVDWLLYRSIIGKILEKLCGYADILQEKYYAWVIRRKIDPYLAEYIYILCHYQAIYILFIPLIFVVFWILTTFRFAFLFVGMGYLLCLGVFFISRLHVLLAIPFKKIIVTKKAELVNMTNERTNPNAKTELDLTTYMPEIYGIAIPVFYMYRPLPENAVPKASPKKKPMRIFEEDCDYIFFQKASAYFRIILTEEKSRLLDDLIRLEPSGEFEIRYRKFGKMLVEIRPIEGWEYAEGVAELCEKISKMYP